MLLYRMLCLVLFVVIVVLDVCACVRGVGRVAWGMHEMMYWETESCV